MCPRSNDSWLIVSIALVVFAASIRSDRERLEPCRAAVVSVSTPSNEPIVLPPPLPSTKPLPTIEEPRSSRSHYAFDRTYPNLVSLVHDVETFTGRRIVVGPRVRALETRIRSRVMPDTASFYQAFLSLLSSECIAVLPAGSNLRAEESSCGPVGSGSHRTCALVGSSAALQTAEIVELHRVAGTDAARVAGSMLSSDGSATALRGSRTLIVTDNEENASCIVALVERLDDAEPSSTR